MTLLCKCGNTCNAHAWGGNAQAICHRCGRQWEFRRMTDANDWVEVVASWEDRCAKYMRERDEARADLAATQRKLGIAQKDVSDAQRYADRLVSERDEARADHRRSMHAAIEDRKEIWGLRERLEQAVALLREARTYIAKNTTPTAVEAARGGIVKAIDAFTAGQPAPVKPVVDDAMVERANAAYVEAVCKYLNNDQSDMDENPMRAALVAALEGRT